jgi:hypothetical protein
MTGTTTAAPSPYAPGKLPDEPAVVRPAGRAAVFLWAIAVWAIAAPGVLWRPWTLTMMRDHRGDAWFNAFTLVTAAFGPLGPVLAYLGDRVPVLGTRREGHLLLASLVSAGAWLLVAFGPRSEAPWLAITGALGVAAVMATAATNGALAEIGQRRGTTGLLAAASLAIVNLGGFASGHLDRFVYDRPLAWTGGVGAGLAVSVVLAIVFLSQPQAVDAASSVGQAASVPAPGDRTGLRAFLGRRTFWVTAAMVSLNEASRIGVWMPRELSALRAPEALARGMVLQAVAMVAAAAAYALLCRRTRPRTLLPMCLLASSAGRAAFGLAGESSHGTVADGLGGGLGYAAMADLTLRSCPRGREAFGYMLLMFPRALFTSLMPVVLFRAGASVNTTTAAAAAGPVLAAVMVVLLPRPLLAAPDRPPPDRAA